MSITNFLDQSYQNILSRLTPEGVMGNLQQQFFKIAPKTIPYVQGASQSITRNYKTQKTIALASSTPKAIVQLFQDSGYRVDTSTSRAQPYTNPARSVAPSTISQLHQPSFSVGTINQGFLSNGNPKSQKGFVPVSVNGIRLGNIANNVMQQQAYTAAVNQGRYNPVNFFKASGKREAGQNYTNYDATKSRLARLQKQLTPILGGKGALEMDWYSAQNQQNQLQRQINSIRQTPRTEIRNIGGRITGGNYLAGQRQIQNLQNQQKQIRDKMENYNPWVATRRADQLFGETTKMYRHVIAPTYSNLPIKETLIK